MRVKSLNKEYLPIKLIHKVNEILPGLRDYRTKDNLLLMVGVVFDKMMSNDSLLLNSYHPIASAYWKKIIGSHYSPYAKILVEENIIQTQLIDYTDDSGNISRVNGYRINPDLLNDDFSEISYHQDLSSASHGTVDKLKDFNLKGINQLSTKLSNIKMLKDEALEWVLVNASDLVEKQINPDFINGLPANESIKVKILYNEDNSVSQYLSVESAKKIAKDQDKELFYFKDKFIIADKELFIRLTTNKLIYRYRRDIASFNPANFNLKRNDKTLRVYSQLTSLPSVLLQFVRVNGDYIMQADLKCSQFTLFANLLNLFITHKDADKVISKFKKEPTRTFVKRLMKAFDKHKELLPEKGLDNNSVFVNNLDYRNNDVYKFLVDVLTNDFYQILQKDLKLPQRSIAKTMAFTTVFSNPKRESYYTTRFREIYPSVISIINDFKNEYGYNQFAIGLQNVEAEIFIDHLWKKAIQEKVNSFTRHDSLVFPLKLEGKVKPIINKVFEDFGFIYRIDYESPNKAEFMEYLFENTQYLDSLDGEFDELFFYTMENPDSDTDGQDHDFNVDNEIEIIEDMDDDFDDSMDEVYSFNNLENILHHEEQVLPDEIEDDYYGIVPIEVLEILVQLEEIDEATRKALQEDIDNLGNNLYVQYPSFQDETNQLITELIMMLG